MATGTLASTVVVNDTISPPADDNFALIILAGTVNPDDAYAWQIRNAEAWVGGVVPVDLPDPPPGYDPFFSFLPYDGSETPNVGDHVEWDGAGWTNAQPPSGGAVETLANFDTQRIAGRLTAGSGASEELTAAQVRALLNVEDGATADQTPAEIASAYEGEPDTNRYDNAAVSKLAGIEAGATADQAWGDIAGEVSAQSDLQSALDGKAATGHTHDTLANIAQDVLVGRLTAGSGESEELTAAQVRTLLNVEDGATADQTGAEIAAAYEGETDRNQFSDNEKLKLSNIESGATADLSSVEVQTLYESNADTNRFTTSHKNTVEATSGTNTGDEPDAGPTVKGIVELATIAEVDTGTDTERAITPEALANSALAAKVAGIEAGATADQTATEMGVAVHLRGVDASKPAAAGNTGVYYTSTDINGGTTYRSNGTTWDQIAPGISEAGALDLSWDDVAYEVDITGGGSSAPIPVATGSKHGLMSNTDKSKVDAIEGGATADQTAGEIEAAVDHDNLVGFVAEEHIRWDLTGAEQIHGDRYTPGGAVDYLSNFDQDRIAGRVSAGNGITEELTAAQVLTLLGVETGATADQTGAEIAAAYEAEADRNAYTDAEQTKVGHLTVTQAVDLDAIETRVNELDASVILMGTFAPSGGSFPGGGTAQAGESWIASDSGTIDGVALVANDRVVAITDNASTSTYATNWHHLDYTDAVLSVDGSTGAVDLSGSYHGIGGTDVPVGDGGTGASDAATARGNLGLAIGSDVQAHSAILDATTASFLTADETKLDAIADGATANDTDANLRDRSTHTGEEQTDDIADEAITNPKLAHVPTQTFKGRTTAATGDVEDLTAAQARGILNVENGATADQSPGEIEAAVSHDNLQGVTANEHIDWTSDQGATDVHAGNIPDLSGTYAPTAHTHDDLADVLQDRIVGRVSAGAGVSEELTAAQVRTLLGVEAGATADQTAGEIEAAVSHDNLQGVTAAEHIDWTVTGAEDVHADRIAAGAVTQHEGSISHDGLSGFVGAEHIDWAVTGPEQIHGDRYSAGGTVDVLSNFDTARIAGRVTAGNGDSEELTAAQVLTLLGVETGATADQTAGEIEAAVSHDNLQGVVAAEHIRWDLTGAEDVHGDRIPDLSATYHPVGGTDVPVADGGTGASDEATARTNLGLAIGSDVQAHSAVLDATTASFTTADETKLDAITGTNTGDEPAASDTVAGIVELATDAETDTGTDATRAVTPAGLKSLPSLRPAFVGNATPTVNDDSASGYQIADLWIDDPGFWGAPYPDFYIATDVTVAAANWELLYTSDVANLLFKPKEGSGAGAPGSAPGQLGALYVDTTDEELYAGIDTAASSDFVRLAQVAYVDDRTIPTAVNYTGTTDTLALTDANKTLYYSNAAQVTVTIPTNASVAFPIGTRITLLSTGAGGITLTTTSLTLLPASPNKTIAQGEALYLEKTATDTWIIIGGTAA